MHMNNEGLHKMNIQMVQDRDNDIYVGDQCPPIAPTASKTANNFRNNTAMSRSLTGHQ